MPAALIISVPVLPVCSTPNPAHAHRRHSILRTSSVDCTSFGACLCRPERYARLTSQCKFHQHLTTFFSAVQCAHSPQGYHWRQCRLGAPALPPTSRNAEMQRIGRGVSKIQDVVYYVLYICLKQPFYEPNQISHDFKPPHRRASRCH